MLNHLKQNLRHLPMVATAIGKKMGVKIVFTDQITTAGTDGKTIYLPNPAMAGTDKDLQLLEGLIDHEAAHLRYTDFGVVGETSLIRTLMNIMEDIRIERSLAKAYPGSKRNLNRALEIMVENGAFPLDPPDLDNQSVVEVLVAALLFGLRHQELNQSILEQAAQEHLSALQGLLGTKITAEIIAEARKGSWASSTKEVKFAAESIISMIEQAATEPPPPPPAENDSSDDDSESEGDQEQAGNSQDQDGQGEQSEQSGQDNQDGQGDGSSEQSSGSSEQSGKGGQGQSQSADSSGQAEPSGSDIQAAAQAMLDDAKDESLMQPIEHRSDIGNSLKDEAAASDPQNAFKDSYANWGEAMGCGKDESYHLPSECWDTTILGAKASLMLQGLDRKLETLLEAKLEASREYRKSGLLASNRLAGIAVGNTELFYRDYEVEGLNTAVTIICDHSGSMKRSDVSHGSDYISRGEAAAAACFALTRTMGRLAIPFSVMQFNSQCFLVRDMNQNGLLRTLRENPTGSTRTAHAVVSAANHLASRQEERKLIIMLIDGQDDPVEMALIKSELRKTGIELAGIFIGTKGSEMAEALSGDLCVVNDSTQLTGAMFNALESVTK